MSVLTAPYALSLCNTPAKIQHALSVSNVSFPLPQNCILLSTANSAIMKLKGNRENRLHFLNYNIYCPNIELMDIKKTFALKF